MDMKVIRIEKKLCTCCMEVHDIKVIETEEHTIFKGLPVDYTANYYYCDAADEFYVDETMASSNDICMKDIYRKMIGMLTSKEIHAVRVKYGISQSDLCTLLGWGGKTITRYEGHQVQDKAHDMILRKLDQDPEWLISLLKSAKGAFSQESYSRYLKIATMLYEKNQDDYLRRAIEARYACFYENKMYNGDTILSLDKVVDMIRYFANSSLMVSLYKVKLMKLLWYSDFLSYKRREHGITGLVYQAMPMGAVPIGHDSIIQLKGIEKEEIDMGDGIAYKFHTSKDRKYPNLSNEDKRILDTVIGKFGEMSKDEIVSFMHREQAYTETPQRDIIQYKYARELLLE